MFEVKWFLFKSEKEMNADKILPIDLYHAVSIANLTLESAKGHSRRSWAGS